MKQVPQHKPIPSPCVNICVLDDDDICIGCSRHGNEISHWGNYSELEKKQVWEKIKERNQRKTL